MRKKKYYRISFLLIIAAGLLLRLLYLQSFSSSPLFYCPLGPDVEEYDKWAREILAGRWLWTEVNIHAPLYSYFLALLYWITNMGMFAVRLIQSESGYLAGLVLLPVLARVSPVRKYNLPRFLLPLLFLIFWSFYPPLIYYQAEIISEALLLPLLCIQVFCLYFAERAIGAKPENKLPACIWFGAAGLLAGLAVITHPMALVFVGCEIIYILFRLIFRPGHCWRPWLAALILYGALAAPPVIPVVVYNTSISGELVLVQRNSGFNFWLGNHQGSNGTCSLRPGPEWDRIHRETEKTASAKGVSKDRVFLGRSMDFIASHPFRWVGLLFQKTFLTWNYRELTAGADVGPIRYYTAMQRYSSWAFAVLAVPALAGLILSIGRKRYRHGYRHFLILLAAFWLAQIITVTSGRYRIAMLPAIMVLAADFWIFIPYYFAGKLRPVMTVGALLGATLVVLLPLSVVDAHREEAEAATILAQAEIRNGDYPEAYRHLKQSEHELGDWSRTHDLFGQLQLVLGNNARAHKSYLKAIACDPDSPHGYTNLGVICSNSGNLAEAAKYFKVALEKSPKSPEALYNYGFLMLKMNRLAEAQKWFEKCLKAAPAFRKALTGMGAVYLRKGNTKKAIGYFLLALKLEPNNPKTLLNLSAAYAAAGDRATSGDYYDRAMAIDDHVRGTEELRKFLGKPKHDHNHEH